MALFGSSNYNGTLLIRPPSDPKKCGCINGVVVLTGVDQITVPIFFK